MTTMIKPDTRGVDALSGQLDDNLLQPLIFDELLAEMAMQLADAPWPDQLPAFDETPWQELPTLDEMEPLWSASAPVDALIARLGITVHGDGEDLGQFMARQWHMAELELEFKRQREAQDAARADDDGAAAGAAGLVSAETRRGGGDLPGGSEDGVALGEGGKAGRKANSGRTSKVSGKRGSGKAAG